MNRRVLFISIAAVVVVLLLGVAVWLLFAKPISNQQTVENTPEPIDTGTLPVTSSDPIAPIDIPTPFVEPSGAPVAFQGVCPDTWVSQVDTDNDGLPDAVEATYGTDANLQDTDSDSYNDSAEVKNGYNPLDGNSQSRLDSDNDGLFDNDECVWHTDTFNPDSDTDGFQDGAEVRNGYDPTKTGDGYGSDKLVDPNNPPTTPVPIITNPPTNTAQPIIPGLSNTPVQISLIALSQLQTTTLTAPADVKAYLAQVDSLRPQELTDGQLIATAIQNAATGNVAPLAEARSRIAQFSAALKGVPAPKPAHEYHQLYISLIDFTVQRLQLIEQNVTGDQQKAAQAVVDIQNTLPSYVARLTSLRSQVEGIASQ